MLVLHILQIVTRETFATPEYAVPGGRWSLAAQLLAGIQAWRVPSTSNELEQIDAIKGGSKKPPRTSKHESRADKAGKQEVKFPGSFALSLAPLASPAVAALQHFKALEILVSLDCNGYQYKHAKHPCSVCYGVGLVNSPLKA